MTTPDFVVPLAGRDIGFKNPNPAQLMMLRRLGKVTQDQIDALLAAAEVEQDEVVKGALESEAALFGADYQQHIWDAVDSLVVEENDRAFLISAMVTGKLDMSAAYQVFRLGKDTPPDDDADPPVTVSKTAPKAVKAARPASKSASRAAKKTVRGK